MKIFDFDGKSITPVNEVVDNPLFGYETAKAIGESTAYKLYIMHNVFSKYPYVITLSVPSKDRHEILRLKQGNLDTATLLAKLLQNDVEESLQQTAKVAPVLQTAETSKFEEGPATCIVDTYQFSDCDIKQRAFTENVVMQDYLRQHCRRLQASKIGIFTCNIYVTLVGSVQYTVEVCFATSQLPSMFITANSMRAVMKSLLLVRELSDEFKRAVE